MEAVLLLEGVRSALTSYGVKLCRVPS